MSDLLGIILGPLGAIIGGVALAVLAWVTGRQQGKRNERDKRTAEDAKAYQDKRKEIDNADLGHGATDAERIKRLQSIADRAGSGSGRR